MSIMFWFDVYKQRASTLTQFASAWLVGTPLVALACIMIWRMNNVVREFIFNFYNLYFSLAVRFRDVDLEVVGTFMNGKANRVDASREVRSRLKNTRLNEGSRVAPSSYSSLYKQDQNAASTLAQSTKRSIRQVAHISSSNGYASRAQEYINLSHRVKASRLFNEPCRAKKKLEIRSRIEK